ncbi:MAG: hypothetical protein WBK09_03300 [Limnohabitans sp.]|uniref:hypothetical protein n=1 Tax=Limnohabitans sp. TaxID=1907725 RepID=UPI003BB0D604
MRELTEEEVFGPSDARASDPPKFVHDFSNVLDAMQRLWTEARGLEDAPPVALLVDNDVPGGVKVFAWPSPWLH